MDGISFIQDLAVVLLAAAVAGSICRRIGLSVIVGYLIAGMIVGPYTPPFSLVLDVARIETLSQIGLIFLMFAIGLGLSLSRLRLMGATTFIATGLGAFFVLNLTQLLGFSLGWTAQQSLFTAAMLMVSSSAVISKVVHELKLEHERPGQLALTITVLEDVVAVVLLAILGSISAGSGQPAGGLVGLLGSLSAFVVLLVMAGLFLVPRLLRRLEARADPELQTIAVAGVLLLMALLAVRAGYSLALGAFLLGAIVAEMPQSRTIGRAFTGLRDIFSSVFFVSIGMMIDVRMLADVWVWILGLGIFTLLSRTLATASALTLVGTPHREALRAGLALTPLGEFTFVIAQLGVASAVMPKAFYPVAVGVSLLTVILSPMLNRHANGLLAWVERVEPHWLTRLLNTYRDWLHQLSSVRGGQWWQLSKRRLIQIGLEALFVTGLLIFSERLLAEVQAAGWLRDFAPGQVVLVFWIGMGLVVVVPLIAIWRNVAAVGMIFSEEASRHTRLPGQVIDAAIKVISALAMASWLGRILPTDSLPRWAWLIIAVILAVAVAVFSRRMIYWHSRWEESLSDVFRPQTSVEAGGAGEAATRAKPSWLATPSDWNINVQECVLPEGAACGGRSIADLRIRSRFGCSIMEIHRHGSTLIAPEPNQVLYGGDRLLLLGTREQIERAREALTALTPPTTTPAFDEARLETLPVPAGSHVGKTLAELRIHRHAGVLIAGHGRLGRRRINPPADQTLEVGDELLVLGGPRQIREFKHWLQARPDAGTPGAPEPSAPASP
jgi:CPA2 family monovalent cation:H+ antiporter-2